MEVLVLTGLMETVKFSMDVSTKTPYNKKHPAL